MTPPVCVAAQMYGWINYVIALGRCGGIRLFVDSRHHSLVQDCRWVYIRMRRRSSSLVDDASSDNENEREMGGRSRIEDDDDEQCLLI